MKKILSIIIIMIFGATVYAQDTREISDASDMKKRQATSAEVDSAVNRVISSNQEFMDMYNWLMETPIHEQEERRQIVNAAISNYIEQNPNFDIELDVKLLKFADTSPALLTVFMGGYTAYIIENNNVDPLEANVAGIESVIEYYKRNEEYLEKDKKVEKFIKKEEKDKLENYVERKIN